MTDPAADHASYNRLITCMRPPLYLHSRYFDKSTWFRRRSFYCVTPRCMLNYIIIFLITHQSSTVNRCPAQFSCFFRIYICVRCRRASSTRTYLCHGSVTGRVIHQGVLFVFGIVTSCIIIVFWLGRIN